MLYTSYKHWKWSLFQPCTNAENIWRAFVAGDKSLQLLCCQWPKHNQCRQTSPHAPASSFRMLGRRQINLLMQLLNYYFFTMAHQPRWAKVSSLPRIHDHIQTHHHSVGLIWASDQPDAETSDNTQHTRDRHPCPWRDSNSQFHNTTSVDKRAHTRRLLTFLRSGVG